MEFYELLYCDPDTLAYNYTKVLDYNLRIDKVRTFFDELTQGLRADEIKEVIERAVFTDDGWRFAYIIELSFPNNVSVYFESFYKELPPIIQFIYLPESCQDLISLARKSDYIEILRRPGMGKDQKKRVYVLKEPHTSSDTAMIINPGEWFYYSPKANSEYWPVYKTQGKVNLIGYLSRYQIASYQYFSDDMKALVKKDRGGK